jgi:hypothetical protein
MPDLTLGYNLIREILRRPSSLRANGSARSAARWLAMTATELQRD